jgi:hypothetical protein
MSWFWTDLSEATRDQVGARAKTLGVDTVVLLWTWHVAGEELVVSPTEFPSGINSTVVHLQEKCVLQSNKSAQRQNCKSTQQRNFKSSFLKEPAAMFCEGFADMFVKGLKPLFPYDRETRAARDTGRLRCPALPSWCKKRPHFHARAWLPLDHVSRVGPLDGC